MTCGRAREFLERTKLPVKEEVSARRSPYGRAEALALVRKADRLVAAKGTRVTEVDLRKKPAESEILALMLGPTGGLRAPTLVVGKTIYVGFPKGGFPGLG